MFKIFRACEKLGTGKQPLVQCALHLSTLNCLPQEFCEANINIGQFNWKW